MKIYGLEASTFNLTKVLLTAEELGLSYELIKLNAAGGEHKSAEHKTRHPLGKIPALEDGDRVLFESMAIVRYLQTRSETSLSGDDLHVTDQWSEFMLHHCGRAIASVYWEEFVRVKWFGQESDAEAIDKAKQQLAVELPLLEARLQELTWLGGSSYSQADVVALSYFQALAGLSQTLDDYPALAKWLDAANARNASQRVAAHYPVK